MHGIVISRLAALGLALTSVGLVKSVYKAHPTLMWCRWTCDRIQSMEMGQRNTTSNMLLQCPKVNLVTSDSCNLRENGQSPPRRPHANKCMSCRSTSTMPSRHSPRKFFLHCRLIPLDIKSHSRSPGATHPVRSTFPGVLQTLSTKSQDTPASQSRRFERPWTSPRSTPPWPKARGWRVNGVAGVLGVVGWLVEVLTLATQRFGGSKTQ